jgi:hypothetical protein
VELTREDESILKGEKGPMMGELMQILVTLGELNDASRLIPIWSAHLSGVSFKTMGLPGTEFLEDAAKEVHFSVKTTVNPAGYDVGGPGIVKADEDFRWKQERLVRAMLAMGALPTFTCTPYSIEGAPPAGTHLAWAESSAVIYVNSVIGAFSNREGAPTALASAVVGKTPDYGLHRPEGRHPQMLVDVDASKGPVHFTVLGAYLGKLLGSKIPYIRGVKPGIESMKEMGAAMSAWGSVPMFHVEDVTHEAGSQKLDRLDRMTVDARQLAEFEHSLGGDEEPNLVAIGCPHCNVNELTILAEAIKKRGGKVRPGKQIWAFTNRSVIAANPKLVEGLKKAGVKIVQDTCMVVAPIGAEFPVIAVNSAKAAFYASRKSFSGQKVVFGTTEELIQKYV